MARNELPQLVIDASIATKRHLRGSEEEFLPEADRIFDDFANGRVHLIAPDHIHYEVPAAIRNAVRNYRLTA